MSAHKCVLYWDLVSLLSLLEPIGTPKDAGVRGVRPCTHPANAWLNTMSTPTAVAPDNYVGPSVSEPAGFKLAWACHSLPQESQSPFPALVHSTNTRQNNPLPHAARPDVSKTFWDILYWRVVIEYWMIIFNYVLLVRIPNPLHPIKFISEIDVLFLCRNSQSFHLCTGGGLTFYYTSHVMNRFIPHVDRARSLNGFENGTNLAENRIEYVLLTTWDGNSIFFSAGPVRKNYRQMGLRNDICWGIRKQHTRIRNKFDCVEGVIIGLAVWRHNNQKKKRLLNVGSIKRDNTNNNNRKEIYFNMYVYT